MSQLFTITCGCIALSLFITVSLEAKRDKSITGVWVVNESATAALQDKVRKTNTANRNIANRPGGIVVGIPAPGGVGPTGPNSTLKFPIVLECEEISIDADTKKVKASCETGVSREFLIGKLHGRTTRYRSNILYESYTSTSRSVKHDIRVDRQGNLVAKVKIKPKNGVSQTYVRVYSRPTDSDSVDPELADEEVQETSEQ